MHDIFKKAKAEQDLIDIWVYTYERWGEAQADRYLDELDAGLRTLRRFPEMGADYSHVRTGYRRYSINHHRIFYRLTERSIEIVRVLHESMDPEPYLE